MTDLVPARAELIALLTATRTNWRPADVEAAVVRAQLAAWPWGRTMTGLVMLAADPHGIPDEFAPAVRSARPASAESRRRHIEKIRAALPQRGDS